MGLGSNGAPKAQARVSAGGKTGQLVHIRPGQCIQNRTRKRCKVTLFIACTLIHVANLKMSLTGKPPPFWASWGEQWKSTTKDLNSNAQGWVKGMENRAKTIQMPRWEMPGAPPSLNH